MSSEILGRSSTWENCGRICSGVAGCDCCWTNLSSSSDILPVANDAGADVDSDRWCSSGIDGWPGRIMVQERAKYRAFRRSDEVGVVAGLAGKANGKP